MELFASPASQAPIIALARTIVTTRVCQSRPRQRHSQMSGTQSIDVSVYLLVSFIHGRVSSTLIFEDAVPESLSRGPTLLHIVLREGLHDLVCGLSGEETSCRGERLGASHGRICTHYYCGRSAGCRACPTRQRRPGHLSAVGVCGEVD